MDNELEKKVDSKLTKFNALSYKDKAFLRSIVIGEVSKAEAAQKVYGLETELDGDIKAMTTLSRADIQEALGELNSLQGTLLKSRILNASDGALNKIVKIMDNGLEESDQLKAASTIAKMGVDLVKESERKNPVNTMKVVVDNPSGNVTINFGNDKVMDSFGHKPEIMEGEFEDVDQEEKVTADKVEVAVKENDTDQKVILKKEEMKF